MFPLNIVCFLAITESVSLYQKLTVFPMVVSLATLGLSTLWHSMLGTEAFPVRVTWVVKIQTQVLVFAEQILLLTH